MNVGAAIQQMPDGRFCAYLTGTSDDGISVSLYLCHADDDENIGRLITGLKQVRQDLKRAASGLVTAQAVPPGLKGGHDGRFPA